MDKFIIDGVRPFNRFFFRSCYFHQLISAYAALGIPFETVISNYKSLYRIDGSALICEEKQIFDRAAFSVLTGVDETHLNTIQSDIISFLKENLKCSRPCILIIDYFYLPFRKELYHKSHIDHYILVYGFDSVKSEFIIQELDSDNRMRYVQKVISFAALKSAFESGCKIRKKGRDAAIVLAKLRPFCEQNYISALRASEPKLYADKLVDLKTIELGISAYIDNPRINQTKKRTEEVFENLKWLKLREMNQAQYISDYFEVENRYELSAAYYEIVKTLMYLKNLSVKEKLGAVHYDDLVRLLSAEKKLTEVRYGSRFDKVFAKNQKI